MTKIGDVFSVKLDEKTKKYFQYITNDLTQLNSDVIRAFKKIYPVEGSPDLSELVIGEVDFYAHVVTKWGIQMGLWEKVGNVKDVGKFDHILFRNTNDYARKLGDEPIRISKKWFVWKINDKDFTDIGKLKGIYKNAFVGLVMSPPGIVEMLKGNPGLLNYPE